MRQATSRSAAPAAQRRHERLRGLRHLRVGLRGGELRAGNGKAIYAEFYDGRVQRTVDLETCTFCGACAEACPVDAIDFTQSPELTTVPAGAILTAVGCETAPQTLIDHLGYGHDGVVTQI